MKRSKANSLIQALSEEADKILKHQKPANTVFKAAPSASVSKTAMRGTAATSHRKTKRLIVPV